LRAALAITQRGPFHFGCGGDLNLSLP
jgi:hypothetical protein